MCALRRSAVWPQVVAISLIGLGAASCTDSGRFSDMFRFGHARPGAKRPVQFQRGRRPTVSSAGRCRRLPARNRRVFPGGGRGMGSYQPGNPEITGSVQPPPPPPPPTWSWNGGTPVTVAPGETLDMIARKHGVPVSAIMEANTSPIPPTVHAGQHLVIPRYRAAPTAYAPPATRIATVPWRRACWAAREPLWRRPQGVHVVAPGETLNSIARLYGTSGHGAGQGQQYSALHHGQGRPAHRHSGRRGREPRAEAPPPPASGRCQSESPHSAYNANPVAPPPVQQQTPVKAAEPVGCAAEFPLAGARTRHRRLRPHAQRPAK